MTDLLYDSFFFTNNGIKRMNLHLGKGKGHYTTTLRRYNTMAVPGFVVVPDTDLQEGRQKADVHSKMSGRKKQRDTAGGTVETVYIGTERM